MNDDKLR